MYRPRMGGTALWLAFGLLALAATGARATTIVYPGDLSWSADTRDSQAYVGITGEKPRSGNGSLELRTTGSLSDWGFFATGFQGSPWGRLSDITALGLDWYRETAVTGDAPWQAQTPVLRLYVSAGDVISELVWEKYYTEPGAATVGDWVTQDLTNQNFWRYVRNGDDPGYTLPTGNGGMDNVPDFTGKALLAQTVSQWSAGWGSSDVWVWGLAVGAGSNWPAAYTGFVDNVYLKFGDSYAVDANFELRPVPEPSSLILVAFGLLGIFGGVARRRNAL